MALAGLLLLTNAHASSAEVLPSLGLLLHSVRVAPAEVAALLDTAPADAVLLDARRELPAARELCRLLRSTGIDCPLLLVTSGPAEVEARLRLAGGRLRQEGEDDQPPEIRNGDLVIDEATYTARLRHRLLDLTFKEFELLKYLAQHPGRVFTRAQLLQEVWGYDYFGGTRTVDVHVRRLRAKMGTEHEQLIGTVRNVGYRFVAAEWRGERGTDTVGTAATADDAVTLAADAVDVANAAEATAAAAERTKRGG
jgi:DNA-binding response OmpR family regulator